jgi:predicted DNA-binding WGR domain protein
VRIYMQTPPAPDATLRFCHLLLQQDLLGGWTLVREAGRQGGSGRVWRDHFPTRDEAEAALIRARDQHTRRGYRVVFAEGVAAH